MALFSNQLSVIRQYLSSQVGDLILSTAVAPLGVQYYTDSLLTKADDYYNHHGYRGYCYGGTTIGQERGVYDWVYANRTIVFNPVFDNTIVAGDKFELHHIFTEGEYRRAINQAINHLGTKYLIDFIDVATVLVADTYEYTLPSLVSHISRITTETVAAGGVFANENIIDFRDWRLISPRKLKLDENRYRITAGKDLRIEGHKIQATVSADTDTIEIPPDWLVQKAITFLPMNKIQSNALLATYRVALELSAREPRNWPAPQHRRVVD